MIVSACMHRKMVKQVTTSDLMFGHMPAPPPSHATGQQVEASEILDYFTEQGVAAESLHLSPIAVVSEEPAAILPKFWVLTPKP